MNEEEKSVNEATDSRGTIIVLEDAEPSRNVIEFILKKHNYNVLGFSNGKAALDSFSLNLPTDVKIIFSDVMMPQMNGMEFIQKLKENTLFPKVPIIIMTALSDKEIVSEAKKIGVSGYILKPVTAKKLTEILQKIFPSENFDDFSKK